MSTRLRSTASSLRRLVAQALVPVDETVDEQAVASLEEVVALPGESLGRFRIVELIGAGGMGLVYRARDPGASQDVALKVCRSLRARDDARFDREVAILSQMAHPRIVRYVDHGRLAEGGPWVAMELLEGASLTEHLRRGPLEPSDVIVIGRQIAEALEAAHDAGVVHRDLKTSNVFLVAGDEIDVRLLDFGLAQSSTEASLTAPNVWLGTPGYSAPEQIRDATKVDLRADLFALGVVLFECFARRSPFPAEDTAGALVRTLMVPAEQLTAGEAPPGVSAIVARLLQKDPAARPSSAGRVVAALRRVAAAPPEAPPIALGERIGAGRCVTSYRAARLDRFATVRVERFDPGELEDPLLADELEAEARRASELSCPTAWVPRELFDTGVELLIVLDDVSARSLATLLQQPGELSLRAAACVADDVLAAIEAAHASARPLLHGGVADDVVFVGPHGGAALGAFGPVRAVASGRASAKLDTAADDADRAGEWCRDLLMRVVAGPVGRAAWQEASSMVPVLADVLADPIHAAISDPAAMRSALAPLVGLAGRAELAAWSRSA